MFLWFTLGLNQCLRCSCNY